VEVVRGGWMGMGRRSRGSAVMIRQHSLGSTNERIEWRPVQRGREWQKGGSREVDEEKYGNITKRRSRKYHQGKVKGEEAEERRKHSDLIMQGQGGKRSQPSAKSSQLSDETGGDSTRRGSTGQRKGGANLIYIDIIWRISQVRARTDRETGT